MDLMDDLLRFAERAGPQLVESAGYGPGETHGRRPLSLALTPTRTDALPIDVWRIDGWQLDIGISAPIEALTDARARVLVSAVLLFGATRYAVPGEGLRVILGPRPSAPEIVLRTRRRVVLDRTWSGWGSETAPVDAGLPGTDEIRALAPESLVVV